jgi:hypothetical protein
MMKIRAIALALLLAFATLMSASAPASAGEATSVPVQGSGSGTIRFNTSTGDFTGEESGVSSHLGKYSLHLQGHGARATDGSVTGNGSVTIVAANGDELTGTFTLQGDGETQRVAVSITGGTGRFAEAQGTLTVVCRSKSAQQEGDTLVLRHDCTMTGRISY